MELLKLTKNADISKYKFSGYGIGFDTRGGCSLLNGSRFGKNLIIFVADMSSSLHVDNSKTIS